ncbi:MAG: transferrin-binding protein-like solute binding protein [Rhodospirillales bacterium]|nr:transferrin-binding protein-like solute binding protein [Rhodospirillales bacterium]
MTRKRKGLLLASAATLLLALGLYGCGSGGGSGPMTGGSEMTPKDIDLSDVTPGFMAGAGTVQVAAGRTAIHGDIEFSCATGGADCEVEVMVDVNGDITVTSTGGMVTATNAPGYPHRHGLEASPLASPTALSAADSLENLDQASTAFAPVSAPAKITSDDMGQAGVVVLEDNEEAYVESITHDGAAGYSVVFVVDGQKTQVDFEAADWSWTPGENDYYQKTVDGTIYGFAHTPMSADFKTVHRHYFQLFAWDTGELRGYASVGALTPSQTLVNLGSATYEGHLIAERHNNFADPDFREVRDWIWGELTLNADFSASTITGSTDALWVLLPAETWTQAPDTNSIAISNGDIHGSRFHADWAGQDTDTSSALEDSFRGFEGSMLGEFYGPNGEEVGGVFTGQRAATDQVINGRFGGESQAAAAARMAVQTAAGRDGGISASQDPAVYADSSSDSLSDLLPDGNTAFAPITAAIYRDWDNNEVRKPANGAAFVKSISSDGANGFNVTYVIDGRDTTVHFSADTWSEQWGSYNVNRRGDNDLWRFNDYWLWTHTGSFYDDPNDRTSGSSEFAYFDINGWQLSRTGDQFRGYSVYGAQTRPENLPTGSATYYGRMTASVWLGDNSKPYPEDRIYVYGALTLDADFDNSDVDGLIDELYLQVGDFSEDTEAMAAGNSIGISNGVIADSGFTADWAGTDTDVNSSPYDTVRGFTGTMLGQFYGPEAEEVGGVMNGHRPPTGDLPDQYFNGAFGGTQPDPNAQQ